MKSAK
jgi:hypothetical protein